MPQLLNPDLFSSLQRVARDQVYVINPGVPMSGFEEFDPNSPTLKLKVLARGESYQCSCWFCGDTRGRMSVNHRFGEHIRGTPYYRIELWKCYNEDCQSDSKNRVDLYDDLFNKHGPGGDCRRRPLPKMNDVDDRTLEPCEFPGVLIPIDLLKPGHPAFDYVVSRKFDPKELSEVWGVSYADYVPPRTRGAMAQGRVIVPVTVEGIQIGWQARYTGELDWKSAGVPKYLTYFPKSLAVYGLDSVKDSPYIVLVEGVTDVWRYGPGAVSILGKKASERQITLLTNALKNRPLVLIPDMNDPESLPAFLETDRKVRGADPRPVSLVRLEPGTDPAEQDRDVLRKLAAMAATDQK